MISTRASPFCVRRYSTRGGISRKAWRCTKPISSHGMRNELTGSRLCSAKRLHKQFYSHRLLAGDAVEVLLRCRNHRYNEERSRATSLELYILGEELKRPVLFCDLQVWSPLITSLT